MKNLELPLEAAGKHNSLDFEVEVTVAESDEKISYGLNLREGGGGKVEDGEKGGGDEPVRGKAVENVLLEKLKYDDKYAEGRKEVQKERAVEKENQDVVMEEEKFVAGDEVRVVAGRRNIGLKGSVIEILGRDTLVLKHSITGEEIEVRISDVVLLGSKEEEQCLRKLKELKIRPSNEEGRRSKEQHMKEKSHEIKWFANPLFRMDERKSQIKWYTNPLFMDDSLDLVQGVHQELLETAIPRPGGPVLVLYGEHKGVYGTLMERDREKETGIIRDADTHSLISVGLEQIAEYVGDPAELGY